METQKILALLPNRGKGILITLSSPKRRLYRLEIIEMDIHSLAISAKKPSGRQTEPDPNETWTLHLLDGEVAFAIAIETLRTEGIHTFLTLRSEAHSSHRRQAIRFAIDSRNPIRVTFRVQQEIRTGALSNVSTGGIGIWLERQESYKNGETLADGHFTIHGTVVDIPLARITHTSIYEEGQIIGLEFLLLSPGCALALKRFLADYESVSSTSSIALDE